MSRIVVTGGAGFLGSHLADVLSDQGHEVLVFDRQHSPYLRPEQQMVVGDLDDETLLAEALDGAAAVFHLAALADLNAARTQPVATAQTNVLGTVRLLEAARLAGIRRVLLASTVYVYSREGGFYRCSKQACEAYVEEFHRQYGLEYTILRYGSLYGPRADPSNGVYRLLRQAYLHGKLQHTGGAEDMREYVHVEDAARLSAEAMLPEHANRNLLITGHHPTRLGDLFAMFGEIMGRELSIEYLDPAPGQSSGHYRTTPYAFQPKVGRKLTSPCYVDMGQGILQLLQQLHEEQATQAKAVGTEHNSVGDAR